VLVITILAILFAATGAVALASSTGTLNEPPSVTDQHRGMASGAPLPGRVVIGIPIADYTGW
jgi:hypothetical protein